MISKNEFDLAKKPILLNEVDIQELVEYTDVFNKFLTKTRLSYQIELSKWTFRWKEEQIYRSIETIDEIKDSLIWIKDTYKQFREKKNK